MTEEYARDAARNMQATYWRRDSAMPWHDRKQNIYHPRHPVGRLFRRHNQDMLQKALNRLDVDLASLHILDVGSGFGHWLRHLVELGADPDCMTGVEVTDARLRYARHANPALNWVHGDGAALPFRDGSFDIVFQVVTLSSVLDSRVQERVSAEMSRVLTPTGLIFWIDRARAQPGHLAGFTRHDVARLFPDFGIRLSWRVHPRYYRWFGGRFGQLCELAYMITAAGCESSLYVLQRNAHAAGSQ